MTDETETLGRRAVACKHWRWLPRMRTTCGGTVIRAAAPSETPGVLDTGWLVTAVAMDGPFYGSVGTRSAETCIPDLGDPATLGCIEHGLLPELYRDERAHLWQSVDGRWHWGPAAISWASGATKVEALIAALDRGGVA